MIDDHAHKRIDAVELTLKNHGDAISSLAESIEENTRLTKEIATNTGDLVDLSKGSKVFSRLVIWIAATGAAIITLLNYFKAP